MKHLHETLNLPFELHNRWWSPENIYTNYSWVRESRAAIPQDQRFWDDLLSRALNEYGCLVCKKIFPHFPTKQINLFIKLKNK